MTHSSRSIIHDSAISNCSSMFTERLHRLHRYFPLLNFAEALHRYCISLLHPMHTLCKKQTATELGICCLLHRLHRLHRYFQPLRTRARARTRTRAIKKPGKRYARYAPYAKCPCGWGLQLHRYCIGTAWAYYTLCGCKLLIQPSCLGGTLGGDHR